MAAGVGARYFLGDAYEVVPVYFASLVPHGARPIGKKGERGCREEGNGEYKCDEEVHPVGFPQDAVLKGKDFIHSLVFTYLRY